jgi:hypothetical protein
MESQTEKPDLPRIERQRLRAVEQEAREGRKLGPEDRLMAAWHLTRAWRAANEAGLRKEDFQLEVLERLTRQHARREEFRLANWTLRRGEDPRIDDLRATYATKSTPQRALEAYLAAVAVAAQHCGVDPDIWKLDMMRDLKLWNRSSARLEVQPMDDRPAETLAMLIAAMCTALGRRNRLQDVFDAISSMNCRWEMFGDRLVATDLACMQGWHGRINDGGRYFEEMFPFPSVSLVRVPYLTHKARFAMAPEEGLSGRINEEDALRSHLLNGGSSLQDAIADAPDRVEADGWMAWYRDVRLCIMPDGHGGYLAGLESRPHLEVCFDGESPFRGRHHVQAGFEPSLTRPLFYARDPITGEAVWPHLVLDDGSRWRICYEQLSESLEALTDLEQRDPETTGWQFDPDPIGAPGEVFEEPWYLSYSQATPDYLRHWLTDDWRLGALSCVCDWSRGYFPDWDDPASRWSQNLPPIRELCFPGNTSAAWVECCLHNGLIEEAMQASIDRLKSQVAGLQADWQAARDRNAQVLLARWSTRNDQKELG